MRKHVKKTWKKTHRQRKVKPSLKSKITLLHSYYTLEECGNTRFVDYHETQCPYCGGQCRWHTIGHVNKDEETWNRYLDDKNYCAMIEVTDEGGGTIGYTVCCHNQGEEE